MKVKELFETEERSILSVFGKQETVCRSDWTCSHHQLTSLKGASDEIKGTFYASKNKLSNLIGGPSFIHGSFYCDGNELTSLEGAPQHIGGSFECLNNKLTSLKGIHKQIMYIGELGSFGMNPIESHVLGLLKISGLKRVVLKDRDVTKIINKYLSSDRDIFACQEELIEAGFPEFAQL